MPERRYLRHVMCESCLSEGEVQCCGAGVVVQVLWCRCGTSGALRHDATCGVLAPCCSQNSRTKSSVEKLDNNVGISTFRAFRPSAQATQDWPGAGMSTTRIQAWSRIRRFRRASPRGIRGKVFSRKTRQQRLDFDSSRFSPAGPGRSGLAWGGNFHDKDPSVEPDSEVSARFDARDPTKSLQSKNSTTTSAKMATAVWLMMGVSRDWPGRTFQRPGGLLGRRQRENKHER